MSYDQASNQTHKTFQVYVGPTMTNINTNPVLIYTHSEGMGSFLVTGIYFYVDSQSGTAGTLANINVGSNATYSDLVVSGSTSNGGSNYQFAYTLADTSNQFTGISGSQQVYAKFNRTGTNFVTGAIVMIGYHSHNSGDVLNQDQ